MSASVTGMASSRGRNIEWQGDDFAAYEQHLGQIKDQMLEDVYDDLNDIGQDAKSNIRHMIQMSGTATRPDGRVETGAMLEAVDYVVTRMGDEIELKFGWVDGGPGYTRFQDRGTRDLHNKQGVDPFNKGGIGIPGMFALLDTFVRAREMMNDRGMYGDR